MQLLQSECCVASTAFSPSATYDMITLPCHCGVLTYKDAEYYIVYNEYTQSSLRTNCHIVLQWQLCAMSGKGMS